MELLIGSVISLLVSGIRLLAERFGKEYATAMVLVLAFLLSLLAASIWTFAPRELVESGLRVFGVSVGFYEAITKRLLAPALGRFVK